jgi:Histidine kinase-like ATPase domain
MLVLAGMAEAVAQEVHGAALPAAAEDLRDRGLQPGMRVGDGQLHADQAALDQTTQEAGPERLGLGLPDIDREDLAPAGLMDTMRDHERLVDDAPAVAHLLDLGVEEHIRVAALQRPGPERVDVLVQRRTDATDLAPGNAQPEALDQLVDASCRHAAHIRLLDHCQQCLLRAPARLQKRREIAALPDLRDLQLDFARPGVPAPSPIAVAVRGPVRGPPLAALSPDQLGHLELHQLRRDGLDRLADHVGVLIEQHLPDDLLDRHPVGTGHAAPPFVRAVESPTIFSAASAGTTFRPTSTYTTLRDVTRPSSVEVDRATVPCGPQAPSLARTVVARWLDAHGHAELRQDACLLVSELVTNSVRHADQPVGAPVHIRASVVDGVVRIEVADLGHGAVRRRVPVPGQAGSDCISSTCSPRAGASTASTGRGCGSSSPPTAPPPRPLAAPPGRIAVPSGRVGQRWYPRSDGKQAPRPRGLLRHARLASGRVSRSKGRALRGRRAGADEIVAPRSR